MSTTNLGARRRSDSVHTGWLAEFRIDPVVMRIFIWTGVALVAATIVGFGWLMHMVPPPSPSDSSEETLAWVQNHQTSILIGAVLVIFFWSFSVTWAAPIILYVRRMERVPLLTFASLANVGGGAAVITMIAVSWTVMAFRAENPLIVQAFNDLGFFLFLYTWPPFGILMVIIVTAIFRNADAHAPFPRSPTTTCTRQSPWRPRASWACSRPARWRTTRSSHSGWLPSTSSSGWSSCRS
jgi:hypothetical protein